MGKRFLCLDAESLCGRLNEAHPVHQAGVALRAKRPMVHLLVRGGATRSTLLVWNFRWSLTMIFSIADRHAIGWAPRRLGSTN
jgi:hypothetical protein